MNKIFTILNSLLKGYSNVHFNKVEEMDITSSLFFIYAITK